MRSQLAQQVFEGCHGMIENHPWSDPSHDVFDLCLHVRTIAMHGALFASRLVLSESASVQATVGIIQQSLTLRAERMIPFLLATVDSNHLLDHLLFFFRSQFFCHDVQGFLLFQSPAVVAVINHLACHSSVDANVFSRDEACFFGTEEERCMGDVHRQPHASRRLLCRIRSFV